MVFADLIGIAGMAHGTCPCPGVMGHEFCGIIEEVGAEVRNFQKGDRVIAPFIGGRGTCNHCREGLPHVC